MLTYNTYLSVICGPPLHGKTTVAERLAVCSNMKVVDVDDVGKDLFPDKNNFDLRHPIRRMFTASRYALMMVEACRLLEKGNPVILPATFSHSVFKAPLLAYMREEGHVPVKI